jgi:hypothetical protein
MTRTALRLNLFFLALAAFFVNPRPNQAISNLKTALPGITGSYQPAPERMGSPLHGVHVENVLDLPIVQQPADQPYYVSDRNGEVTEFSMVENYGSIGLLAHNTLSGKQFSQLAVGQEIHLTYQNGRVDDFVVTQVLHYQALQPESISSSFRNLHEDETLTATELFNRAYVGGNRLVFQTCIAAEGDVSWGRLFVIAMPKE